MQRSASIGVAGKLGDEPWGATLASIARRQLTGQLHLRSEARVYRIAFVNGRIVAASSPLAVDSIVRIALTSHLITSSQTSLVAKQVALAPGRDEVDVVAATVRLSVDQVAMLRRRTALVRTARTFAAETGEYAFASEITLPSVPGIDVDVRTVISRGAHMHLGDYRLSTDLRRLGTRFRLVPRCEIAAYELGLELSPVVEALRDGVSFAELDARHRSLEPRAIQAAIYALVIGGAAEVIENRRAPSVESIVELASRTRTTDWRPTPRKQTSPPPSNRTPAQQADDAFQRGIRALRCDDIASAVEELTRATSWMPRDVDYAAMLAWAKFCAAPDKSMIAADTRRVLERAILKSRDPMTARFYLGRVERMCGRLGQAMHHFREVLEIEPGNADAAAEIRMLEYRAASGRRR